MIIFILLIITIGILTYINIDQQTRFFQKAYSEKAEALAQSFDVSITNRNQLKNEQELQNLIGNFVLVNRDVLLVNINTIEDNNLTVVASTNSDLKKTLSSVENQNTYETGETTNIPEFDGESHTLTVITPFKISGQIAGTYELVISMDDAYTELNIQIRNLILIAVIALILCIVSFLYMLRRIIVKPITKFRDATVKIRNGELDTKIDVKSRDELGDLARAFNHMTSDLKRSKEEIEEYSRMQEKLLKQKDEFVSQLGHDLKNPLTPIISLLDVIKRKTDDPDNKKIIDVIYNNAMYLRELVFNLLRLAKLNTPTFKIEKIDVNIYDLVDEVIIQNKITFENKMINSENNTEKDIVIQADKLLLKEVINNITSNAIKFTGKNGKITYESKINDDSVLISVRDSGIGMASDQIEHVFEEFYKADQSRHDMKSSGLGLTICKRIVEIHGGKIWAENNPDKGLKISFTLPYKSEK